MKKRSPEEKAAKRYICPFCGRNKFQRSGVQHNCNGQNLKYFGRHARRLGIEYNPKWKEYVESETSKGK